MRSLVSLSRSFFLLCILSLLDVVRAFTLLGRTNTAPPQRTLSATAEPSSSAFTVSDLARLKSVGGGLPVEAPGDLRLFDPSTQGKVSSCNERIERSFEFEYQVDYLPLETPDLTVDIPEHLDVAQHFLEDVDGAPFAKASQPVQATCLGRVPLITPDAPGDIQHILLQLPKGMQYLEGQSLSVIPPGFNDKGKPHKPRLYSIASTRYGELLDGNTVSLCVRRAEYVDPATGRVDPTKAGVCSNYLCDLNPGDPVQVAGPVGKTMLLPEDVADRDLIMVATGTGVAPFRGFLRRLFAENTVARHQFNGHAWLLLGVPVTGGLLYADEFQDMAQQNPEQLAVSYAISREMTNRFDGGKLYVQHVLLDNAETVFAKLNNGAHIYFCGLKGMMPGILEALEMVASQKGLVWKDYLSDLKKKGQWHVEVY